MTEDTNISELRPNENEEQINALKDELLRTHAEMENMRKRFEKERTDALKFGAFKFAKELLPVIDGFDMALKSIHSGQDTQTVIEGINIVQKEIHNFLDKIGIEKISSEGELFNPDFHEAINQVEEGDAPSNTIISVMQEGYKLHDRLLRPSLVTIKK